MAFVIVNDIYQEDIIIRVLIFKLSNLLNHYEGLGCRGDIII